MRVLVAGASGAVGRRLVPMLVKAGHSVIATTRTPAKAASLRAAGAEPVVLNALDRAGVVMEVERARPEAVVHQLTSLPPIFDLRKFDRVFALTNRLRSEGTDNLIAAARAAGARRLVAQSYAGWPFARTGGAIKTEEDPLDPDPPRGLRRTLDAIRHLEAAVTGATDLGGTVLRYGAFYGPGTAIAQTGALVEAVRRRRVPLVGNAAGIWSFIHIDDVARATLAAIEGNHPGLYNIVDDEPAPVASWLPLLAATVGAKPPRRIPAFLARLAIGDHGVVLMTQVRGASNAKAKRVLGWHPIYPSWRDGFQRGLGE